MVKETDISKALKSPATERKDNVSFTKAEPRYNLTKSSAATMHAVHK